MFFFNALESESLFTICKLENQMHDPIIIAQKHAWHPMCCPYSLQQTKQQCSMNGSASESVTQSPKQCQVSITLLTVPQRFCIIGPVTLPRRARWSRLITQAQLESSGRRSYHGGWNRNHKSIRHVSQQRNDRFTCGMADR